jgi:hypothetical protein
LSVATGGALRGLTPTCDVGVAEDPAEFVKKVKSTGMRVGIALKPSTKLETILPYVKDVDMVRGLSLLLLPLLLTTTTRC